jgi:hypothetical protein
VGVKLTPPLPAEAGAAPASHTPAISASPFAIRAAVTDGSGRTPLFLRPTELADGLAPKEQRYELAPESARRFAPEIPLAVRNPQIRKLQSLLVPPFPAADGGNSAGL